MSNYRQDPTLFFMMVAVLLLTLVLVVLGLIGFTVMRSGQQSPEPAAEQAFTVAETSQEEPETRPATPVPPTAMPEPTAVPTAVPEPTDVPPTATPEPTPEPAADLVFGVASRVHDCRLMTDVVMQIAQNDFDLLVETREFDSADTLFEGLEQHEADVTLCFVDPDDRPQIKGEDGERLGFIRQIGSHYWDTGDGKLQIWANGAAKAVLREQHACMLQTLEQMSIADGAIEAADAATWLDENETLVREWVRCN